MTELARRQVTASTEHSYASIVDALERVELDARERRLTAQSEADRIRAAAASTAAGIAAGVPAKIAAALAGLRTRHLDAAAAEVAGVEERLAADRVVAETESPRDAAPVRTVPDAALDVLVAAVLAERNG
jgi:hypothetical protein